MADSDMPVRVLMMSGGGLWVGALAIYDAIKDCDTTVDIEVYGCCMSAAVVIAQACERRFIHPNATVMVHNGTHDPGESDSQSFEAWGKWSRKQRERMYSLLAERSKNGPDWWRRKARNGDFILSADEAVELGLFDEVVRRH